MSTFSKLTLIAQYDDMCRLVNKLIRDSAEEEEASISMIESLQKRWNNREAAHEQEKSSLKSEINSLQKEIKKLNRHLTESRAALVREAEEKKNVAREKKTLMDQIRQVRQLVESKDDYTDLDHRKRVIKCLDVERLSPIQSDDSDDCASGLDYDRTEEDILDTPVPRRSNAFEEALESLAPNEQPTILCRYFDKNSDEEQHHAQQQHQQQRKHSYHDEPRRNSRRTNTNTEPDVESMSTDEDIENVRQQLQKYEAEKKEKLSTVNSTPNVRSHNKAGTLAAKSAANLMKSVSNATAPVANTLKPHTFASKKSFKPEHCVPCGGRIAFYGDVVKCENCGVVSHPGCKEKCPLPCVKITAPNTRSRQKKILISDYVNSDAVPKVPALIVHCCNEIEKEENIITSGLYRVVASSKDIEDLQAKILKSKSGMPNLSKIDVNLLTGVVKRFLQTLDESLITTTLWSHFSEATKLDSDEEARAHMSYYISYDLPTANRDTLAFLMQHFHAIAKHADQNLMTTKNLAKTLAPTIVGNSCRTPLQSTIMSETKIQVAIMEKLFEIEEEFWAKYVPRVTPATAASLGSRLLGTPSSSHGPRTRSSRLAGTLPTPKLKPLFS